MEILFNFFILFVLPFAIASFILFFVMKAAVKSALDDIRVMKKDSRSKMDRAGIKELIALRDMELLSDAELEEVIAIYKDENGDKEACRQYTKYAGILNHLRENEYFTDEQYNEKINALKEHYHLEFSDGKQ